MLSSVISRLAGRPGEDVGTGLDRAVAGCAPCRRRGLLCQAVEPIEFRAILASRAGSNCRPAVDAVGFERAPPALEIPGDRRLRHHHVIGEARAMRERQAAGALRAIGIGRVVEEDAAGIEMAAAPDRGIRPTAGS